MTLIIFIVVLAILVFVHELGHFLAAKASGIRVDEFGIGFPPKLVSFTRGETKYSLNAIPFGGFVKIHGEDPDEESISGADRARSFVNKPKRFQVMVLAAGVTFNIIFAWLLLSIGFMIGMPVPEGFSDTAKIENPRLTIAVVDADSPAGKAGLKSGDVITDVTSGPEKIASLTKEEFQNFVAAHDGRTIDLAVTRGEATQTITVMPEKGRIAEDPERAVIGVVLQMVGAVKLSFFEAFWEGMKLTGFLIVSTAVGIVQFLGQAIIGQADVSQVAGPIGIAGLVGDATRLGIVYLISFTAFISINLAVVNLLPLPALDGGRILFVFIEKIKGTRINPKIANTVNGIGFALLILLMIVITFSDIVKLIK